MDICSKISKQEGDADASGGAPCAVHAMCKKQVILDPFSLMANVTAVFPDTGLPQILTQSKTQIMG